MSLSQVILKTRIDLTDYSQATHQIIQLAQKGIAGYIIPANVHVVMTAYWQKNYQQIVNQAILVTPDGMPLVWGLKLFGFPQATRVYGPDLMLTICQQAIQNDVSIYLYGGTVLGIQKLEENLINQFPALKIAGRYSPPFRYLTTEEEKGVIADIKSSGASIVFVGLGCPKQEIWMFNHYKQLNRVLIGVGAAFSFHSGEVSQAPRWLMNVGLEWLYRLSMEPRRLWKRYIINNPTFVALFLWQLLTNRILSKKINNIK